jgi:hypothetical protein
MGKKYLNLCKYFFTLFGRTNELARADCRETRAPDERGGKKSMKRKMEMKDYRTFCLFAAAVHVSFLVLGFLLFNR